MAPRIMWITYYFIATVIRMYEIFGTVLDEQSAFRVRSTIILSSDAYNDHAKNVSGEPLDRSACDKCKPECCLDLSFKA